MAEPEAESPPDEEESKDIEAEAATDEAGENTDIAISYIILAAVSGWALRHTDTSTFYGFRAFTLSFGHGVFGSLLYAHVDGERFINAYYSSLILTTSSVLPLINSELYLKSGFNPYFGYFFTATSFLPFLVHALLADDDVTINVMHGVYFLSLGALIYYIATEQQNNWVYVVAAASMCSATALTFRKDLSRFFPTVNSLAISCFNIAAVYNLAE